VKLRFDNDNGVIRFDIPVGTHEVFAEFRETIPRFAADTVTALSALGLVVYEILVRRKKWLI
jgi:hypothetical protein